MKKMVTVMMLIASMIVCAEMKFGYINSQKVLEESKEYLKAVDQFSKWEKESYEINFLPKEKELRALEEEIKNMSVMVSEEVKSKKIAEAQDKYQEYMLFKEKYTGQNGEYQKKKTDILNPVMDKINFVIKKVSEREKFDFIFDGNVGALLYAKDQYDITDMIIEELNKTEVIKEEKKEEDKKGKK